MGSEEEEEQMCGSDEFQSELLEEDTQQLL